MLPNKSLELEKAGGLRSRIESFANPLAKYCGACIEYVHRFRCMHVHEKIGYA